MRDLIKQEQFELEVLDRLNSAKLLSGLVFGGGTMLRLCYGLNRFSVDLDFWLNKKTDAQKLFRNLKDCLSRYYTVKDATDKFYTILFEIRSKNFPRALKLEIRKELKAVKSERSIAYSKYSNVQVILNALSLKDMLTAKIRALLDRKEIRDAFDIEFLLKKGAALDEPAEVLERLLRGVTSFTAKDYSVKLGSLLEEDERRYYTAKKFAILEMKIKAALQGGT
ncbi:MAG: nucleotidyl transferase AbiEii/AbiGii toxin family protein [Candidatus Omnitrophota bacterium]